MYVSVVINQGFYKRRGKKKELSLIPGPGRLAHLNRFSSLHLKTEADSGVETWLPLERHDEF